MWHKNLQVITFSVFRTIGVIVTIILSFFSLTFINYLRTTRTCGPSPANVLHS